MEKERASWINGTGPRCNLTEESEREKKGQGPGLGEREEGGRDGVWAARASAPAETARVSRSTSETRTQAVRQLVDNDTGLEITVAVGVGVVPEVHPATTVLTVRRDREVRVVVTADLRRILRPEVERLRIVGIGKSVPTDRGRERVEGERGVGRAVNNLG